MASVVLVLKRIFSSVRVYFLVFLGVTFVVSALDYVDHLTRSNTSDFRDAWLGWLGFTLGSTVCMWAVLLCGHLIGPRRGAARLAIDVVACMVVLPIHVYVSGPVLDRLFWDGGLHFDRFDVALLIPFAAMYLVVRGIMLAGQFVHRGLRARNDEGQGAIGAV